MITHKTFSDTHRLSYGVMSLDKREKLRQQAEAFVTRELKDQQVICITESGDRYASSVTVWYRKA